MLRLWGVMLLILSLAPSCQKTSESGSDAGHLRISFSDYAYRATRAVSDIPDTGEFLLSVTSSSGKVVYEGTFADSPEDLIVEPGSYTVTAVSSVFEKPAFSKPVYGDEQCVVVASGGTYDVVLDCVLVNAGVKLKIAANFLTSYPSASLLLKSDDGKLLYSYSEKRVAYFKPGKVSLVLSDGGVDKTLFTRVLEARQVLVMGISAPSGGTGQSSSIKISVDTTKNWIGDEYVIGGGSSGGTAKETAYSVSQAMSEIGVEDVWVYGYIVGGDLTSSSMSFEKPFESNTNIAIASRTSVTDKESCMSVQLPKGKIRDALNLADNPGMLKKKVYLKGDIVESYFGIPGIKNVTEYQLGDS